MSRHVIGLVIRGSDMYAFLVVYRIRKYRNCKFSNSKFENFSAASPPILLVYCANCGNLLFFAAVNAFKMCIFAPTPLNKVCTSKLCLYLTVEYIRIT
jgi:uncharacterized CHY-type Zn-finger protein